MNTPTRTRLRELNDPLLGPLFDAENDAAREAAIDAVVVSFVKPLIDSMIARFRRNEPTLKPEDLEELTSIVAMRVVLKLRATALFEDHAIAALEDYVATMSYHALHDLRRQRHPERYRLKKNLRHNFQRLHKMFRNGMSRNFRIIMRRACAHVSAHRFNIFCTLSR